MNGSRAPRLRVLVACETSGVVRDAFAELGHVAWSCDLLPDDAGRGLAARHWQTDALDFARNPEDFIGEGFRWDLLIAHPPCTYLCSSGLHWNKRRPGREAQTEAALEFVRALMELPIPRICIENPVGRISTAIRPADQYVQPHEFGEDASKRTGLWLKGLPQLQPTGRVAPRIVSGKPRWANQTDSGQNRLGPSAKRWQERSRTYPGIARAMAAQWGEDAR